MLKDRPIRIQIANHSNVGSKPTGRNLWVVSPGAGFERTGADADVSYQLEIDNGYREDENHKPLGDKITRVLWMDGERWVIETDAEFEEQVQAVMENAIKVPSSGIRPLTYAEAVEHLNVRNFASATRARFFCNPAVFDRLIEGWRAANQFLDFAVTL